MRRQYHFWPGDSGLDAWDDGRVMDGMHRIARAILEDRDTIEAVQFAELPEPDHRDCRPEDLPYDR